MAVPCDETVTAGPTGPMRVDKLVRQLPLVFERRSCGQGAKGERFYDWALAQVSWPSPAGEVRRGWCHLLLVRRSISDPTDIAYFAVHARTGTTAATLVKTAGLRWGVEDCFETAKSDWPGPVRGPQVGTLAPAHRPGHRRVRVPVRQRHPHRPPHPAPRRHAAAH
ncbi:hypothetical protein [Streptomyces sp. YIM S03343]